MQFYVSFDVFMKYNQIVRYMHTSNYVDETERFLFLIFNFPTLNHFFVNRIFNKKAKRTKCMQNFTFCISVQCKNYFFFRFSKQEWNIKLLLSVVEYEEKFKIFLLFFSSQLNHLIWFYHASIATCLKLLLA